MDCLLWWMLGGALRVACQYRCGTVSVMDAYPRWPPESENSPAEAPGCHTEPRTGMEAAIAWARVIGVRPGSSASPPARRLVPAVAAWCRAQGWGVEPTDRQVGLAIRALGCRRGCSDRGGWGYRVPRELADSWWAAVGGRPKRARKKTPRARPRKKVPPLFHGQRQHMLEARAVVNSLGQVYPSAYAAAELTPGARGEPGNNKALGNALKASREGRADWGRWRGLLWRYLTAKEVATVPFGTRCGEVPQGWGFGPLRGAVATAVAAPADGPDAVASTPDAGPWCDGGGV